MKKVSLKLFGKVSHGKGMGKSLGFPTANILLNKFDGEKGVYACLVNIIEESPLSDNKKEKNTIKAIANIGTQPSLPSGKLYIEVFLFDFSEDIYDRELEIECKYFLREEKKFASIDELKKQVFADMEFAKSLL